MRRPDIGKLVFDFIFPVRRPGDPDSWATFVHANGNIVKEVREERQRFYGPPPNPRVHNLGYPLEAQFPGLDYNNPWHRRRMSSFRWHAILFKALDTLGITPDEIDSIMTFEGTKYARQQFERIHGVIIKDTTGDEMRPFVEPFLVLQRSNALVSRMMPIAEADVDDDLSDSAGSVNSDQEGDPPDDVFRRVRGERGGLIMSLDSDEEEDMESDVGAQETASHPIRQQVGPSSYSTFVEHFPADQYPDGPPPRFRVHETASDLELAGGPNVSIQLNLGFVESELEEWRKHALERGFRPDVDGPGNSYWNVPRRVARAFMESDNFEDALSTITTRGFYNGVDSFDRRDRITAIDHEESEDEGPEEFEESDEVDEVQGNMDPRPYSEILNDHRNRTEELRRGRTVFEELMERARRVDSSQPGRLLDLDAPDICDDDDWGAVPDENPRRPSQRRMPWDIGQTTPVRRSLDHWVEGAWANIPGAIVPHSTPTRSRAARWHPTLRPQQ